MTFSRGPAVPIFVALGCALSFTCCGGAAEQPQVAIAADGATPAATPDDVGVDGPADPAVTTAATNSGTAAAPVRAEPTEPLEPMKVSDDYAPSTAAGVIEGVPAATNTAPIVALANYFADLPGIDMSRLDSRQREQFLHRANSELCTCGCKDDTLARCYMNDPSCPVVKGMLMTVLDEVVSGK